MECSLGLSLYLFHQAINVSQYNLILLYNNQSICHPLSFMYCSRSAFNINPINVLIDDIVIGTSPNVATNVWTVLNQSFNISQNRTIVLKLLGTSLLDQTTGIDNITIT